MIIQHTQRSIMTHPKIFYTKPSLGEEEFSLVNDAIRNGWGEQCYAYITEFERLFAAHLGVKHAIATSSCTGALHMAMAALGIGPEDEVILPEITWTASMAPITYLGAKPVLVDVLKDSWCIDPQKVEEAITPRTKAIMAVHVYGNLCDMKALLSLGLKYNIPIIEDSAEAIGSIYHGKKAGSMGSFGAFSFHGTKTITTGEGGMFVTNDDALYEKVLTLSNHGRSRTQTKQFWPDEIGFKYKMSNIQAAIGCAQMKRIDELITKKRAILNFYKESLKALPVRVNPEPAHCQNGAWMPTLVVDEDIAFNREQLLQEFAKNNIDARVFFWPLSLVFKEYQSLARENLVAHSLYTRAVNLPSYHDITEQDMQRVIACVKKLF